MIIPEKHLDLNHCVLRAGAVLLRHLKKARVASVAKLRERLVQEMKADGEVLFQPTLNFLFLLGRIEYHPGGGSHRVPGSGPASDLRGRRRGGIMKLVRLYSNETGIFPEIPFRPGLNVILAEVRAPEDDTKSDHNLGKTLLARLLEKPGRYKRTKLPRRT